MTSGKCVGLDDFSGEVNELYVKYDVWKNLVPQEPGEETRYDYQTARIIVKSQEEIADKHAVETAGPYKGIYVLQYATADEAKEAADYYEKQDYVDFVQPDRIMAAQKDDVWEETADGSLFSLLAASTLDWAPQICKYSVMQEVLMEKYGSVDNMPEVVVADIDSGIAPTHPEFAGRILDNGKSFVGKGDSLIDTNGHGTATAGCIAMNTFSNVKILPIRLFYEDNPAYTDMGVYNSIEYAISQGADIINMSFSELLPVGGTDPLMQQAVNDAAKADIIMVAAYGNDSRDTATAYPACYDSVIAVSAIDSDKSLAWFSNYGSCTELSAPGRSIYTADRGGGYKIVSGTSFSCPYVVAGAALVKTYNKKLKSAQVRTILRGNVIDCGTAGWDKYYGYGVLCFENIRQYLNSPANDAVTHEQMTVKYVTNGGESLAAQTVSYGIKFSASDVSRTGYHFLGWYTDAKLTKAFSSATPITSDLVLYAKWGKHTYSEKQSSVTKKSTYTVKGTKQYTCTVCGQGAYKVKLALVKLAAPKVKSVSNTKKGICLSWKKVSGASGYYVYRKTGSGKWKKIKSIKKAKTLTFTDPSVKKGKKYSYRVYAYNKAQKSKASAAKSKKAT